MLKKIVFFISLFIVSFVPQLKAQKTAEIGVFLGRSYYNGEINPKTHWGNGVGSFTYGAGFRYNLNKRYSLKAMLIRTTLSAEDKSAELLFNTFRNASFETKLTEFSGSIEFNFLPYKMGDKQHFFSPYLFVGISAYKYDPNLDIAVTPLEEITGGTSFALPFGPGMKLSLGKKFALAVEWGFRKTSNDELDGLPNRIEDIFELGKPNDNDWYTVTGFLLTYKITDEGPCPSHGF